MTRMLVFIKESLFTEEAKALFLCKSLTDGCNYVIICVKYQTISFLAGHERDRLFFSTHKYRSLNKSGTFSID